MTRRCFLGAGLGAFAAAMNAQSTRILPLGYNTYCLRSLGWDDDRLLQFSVDHQLDAVFLQDTQDPRAMEPSHWAELKKRTQDLGLRIETGTGAVLPHSPDEFAHKQEQLRLNIKRAHAMGSPLMRCLIAGMRSQLPPGPIEQHIETMSKLLKSLRSEAVDANVKFAIEVHKDLQAWEFKMFLDEVGTDFVGIYLDTGNPVFVHEHPLTTVETLAPYALTFHLRDSIVYEHPRGAAVHWVPLGEGTVDFKEIMATARKLLRPDVYVYVKPITGRPAEVLPFLEQGYWETYPHARAEDLARFLTLVRKGVPYDKPVVNEDLLGRKMPDYLLPAIQHQQLDHMERSIKYAKETLDLGKRWRNS